MPRDIARQEFDREYEAQEQQKRVIIQALSASELEEMLRTSTKNVAHEVVTCLIEQSGRGVLTDIIRWLKTSQQNMLNDHLSILDQKFSSNAKPRFTHFDQDGAEGDEGDSENSHKEKSQTSEKSIPSTKPSHNARKSRIRIKVRKSSVEPYSNTKVRARQGFHVGFGNNKKSDIATRQQNQIYNQKNANLDLKQIEDEAS